MKTKLHEIVAVESSESLQLCRAGSDLHADMSFDTEDVRKCACAPGEPIVCDMMALSTVVEFADRTVPRRLHNWRRKFKVRIPMFREKKWASKQVVRSLSETLNLLTGDSWCFSFIPRKEKHRLPSTSYLDLNPPTSTVLAFSDGLDSLAVSGIEGAKLRDELLCVRVKKGTQRFRQPGRTVVSVPWQIRYNQDCRKESTFRSRTFKFIIACAVAAYMTRASRIILPESGQSALGPWLVPLGDLYPDFRNHPLFAYRMAAFLNDLLDTELVLDIPRLWNTKGETLASFCSMCPEDDWTQTKSCWKLNHQGSINGKWHPCGACGACGACMLRRLSVHAAGTEEPIGTYLCDDLNARALDDGLASEFRDSRINKKAFRSHAVAGVRSLSNLADMALMSNRSRLCAYAVELSPPLGLDAVDVEQHLSDLVGRHASEWNAFLNTLQPDSFVRRWVGRN